MRTTGAFIAFTVLLLVFIGKISVCADHGAVSSKDSPQKRGPAGAWNFTDSLGRTMDAAQTPETQTKYVGIFYHLLSESGGSVNNASEIFETHPDALTNSKLWSRRQEGYYWGQPVFGYYDMKYDTYVLRKHAQLLCDAGVDTIIIDYSNACVNGVENTLTDHYKAILNTLCKTFMEIRREGGDTPKITFLLTWSDIGAKAAFAHLYEDLYTNEEYAELWFHWNGKILVVGSGNLIDAAFHAQFEFRTAWPYYGKPDRPNAWPWLSVYPQEPGYTEENDCEIVAVSVAQNWHDAISSNAFCFFSDQDENGNFIAQGRSFTYGNKKLLKDPVSPAYESAKGANFQQQWDRALELDPSFIFITGWNELCVARFVDDSYPIIGKFCDQFTTEFSRDIEPTLQGDLKDNFYCQMMINIRKFKGNNISNANEKAGERASAMQTQESLDDAVTGAYRTITVDGDFEDWSAVTLFYGDDGQDTALRDARGAGTFYYTNTTGRNDFRTMKIAYDDKNVYFYAETAGTISAHTDADWMNLFIGLTDDAGALRIDLPNWEGFQYVLNRENVGDGLTRLERSTGGWNWEVADDYIPYAVKGNRIELAIPRAVLGLSETGRKIGLVFKWADSIRSEGDMLKFYTDGDTAPNARFYYVFRNSAAASDSAAGRRQLRSAVIAAAAAGVCAAAGAAAFLFRRRRNTKRKDAFNQNC